MEPPNSTRLIKHTVGYSVWTISNTSNTIIISNKCLNRLNLRISLNPISINHPITLLVWMGLNFTLPFDSSDRRDLSLPTKSYSVVWHVPKQFRQSPHYNRKWALRSALTDFLTSFWLIPSKRSKERHKDMWTPLLTAHGHRRLAQREKKSPLCRQFVSDDN